MAEFRRAGDERVNVFEVDETYLFCSIEYG
jgi:hypothetical protein